MSVREIKARLRALGDKETAVQQARFFKTGPGEYGEGDIFIGVRVPVLRSLVKEFNDVSIKDGLALLQSSIHEQRLLALLILVRCYQHGGEVEQKKIYNAYLKNTRYINNWDLVDASAEKIVGAYLSGRDKSVLYKMARCRDLWRRRISMMATFYFIRQGEFAPTLRLARQLRMINMI